jgi:hypothetical protein
VHLEDARSIGPQISAAAEPKPQRSEHPSIRLKNLQSSSHWVQGSATGPSRGAFQRDKFVFQNNSLRRLTGGKLKVWIALINKKEKEILGYFNSPLAHHLESVYE